MALLFLSTSTGCAAISIRREYHGMPIAHMLRIITHTITHNHNYNLKQFTSLFFFDVVSDILHDSSESLPNVITKNYRF